MGISVSLCGEAWRCTVWQRVLCFGWQEARWKIASVPFISIMVIEFGSKGADIKGVAQRFIIWEVQCVSLWTREEGMSETTLKWKEFFTCEKQVAPAVDPCHSVGLAVLLKSLAPKKTAQLKCAVCKCLYLVSQQHRWGMWQFLYSLTYWICIRTRFVVNARGEAWEVNLSNTRKAMPNLFPRLVNLEIKTQNGYFKVE